MGLQPTVFRCFPYIIPYFAYRFALALTAAIVIAFCITCLLDALLLEKYSISLKQTHALNTTLFNTTWGGMIAFMTCMTLTMNR